MSEFESFADIYDVWVESAPICAANLPFYVDEYTRAMGPVVELGVGNGRILIEAAKRGVQMVGVDNSPAMLDLCRSRVEQAGVADRVNLLLADMRDFTLHQPAGMIAIPFHSIGHLITLDEKRQALAHIRTQLADDGCVVFDHFCFDPELARANHRKPSLRAEFTHSGTGRKCLLWVTSVFDFERQLIRVVSRIEQLGRQGAVASTNYQWMDFSWLEPDQAQQILQSSGYEVESVFGDFDRSPVVGDSMHRIWRARPAGTE